MPIHMTARFKVKRQSIEKCKQALKDLVDYVRKKERGTVVYLAQQEIADPSKFICILTFQDEVSLFMHQSSPASARFVEAVYPETVEPIEFAEYNIIAGRNE